MGCSQILNCLSSFDFCKWDGYGSIFWGSFDCLRTCYSDYFIGSLTEGFWTLEIWFSLGLSTNLGVVY